MMSLFVALMITPPNVQAGAPKSEMKNHAPTGIDSDTKGFSSLRPVAKKGD
jgi:hypothetical protein